MGWRYISKKKTVPWGTNDLTDIELGWCEHEALSQGHFNIEMPSYKHRNSHGNNITIFYLYQSNHFIWKKTSFIINCNTHSTKRPGSTAKCMVQHKIARFDTKLSYTACFNCLYHNQTPSLLKWFFQFHWNSLFLRTHSSMKMKLY